MEAITRRIQGQIEDEEISVSSCSELTDSDDDYTQIVSSKQPTTKKRCGVLVERQPTRRPDPNVSNRNALLARENRKRKKEYLETLEEKVQNYKKVNYSLQKTLKKQKKMMKKLQNEKFYYKNLLSNQPQIISLMQSFNKNIKSYSPPTSTSCSSGSSPPSFDDSDYKSFDDTNWDLLGINSPFHTAASTTDFDSPWSLSDVQSSISDEHNYTSSPATKPSADNTGICLHIAGDKISVEFCPHCCENSKKN